MRLIFENKEERKYFFEELMLKYSSSSLSRLSKKLGINSKSLSDYSRGRLSIPEKIYNLSSLEHYKNYKLVEDHWGNIIGGKNAFKKNRSVFERGRQNAVLFSKNRAPLFDIFMPLNSDLAYFIGLFIGDGFTNTYQSYYIVQFTGDKRSETIFYQGYISSLAKKLFNINSKIRFDKKGNGLRFNLYSRELFRLITKRFKISAGRKSHFVLIPEEILSSNSKIVKACIRGIYDAEGCIFLDKRSAYKKPYVRIELHMCNLPLLIQIREKLDGFGINSTLGKTPKNLRITIYTEENVKIFIKEIGFSNPKHLEKLHLAHLI